MLSLQKQTDLTQQSGSVETRTASDRSSLSGRRETYMLYKCVVCQSTEFWREDFHGNKGLELTFLLIAVGGIVVACLLLD
jgi:hypothetical protein